MRIWRAAADFSSFSSPDYRDRDACRRLASTLLHQHFFLLSFLSDARDFSRADIMPLMPFSSSVFPDFLHIVTLMAAFSCLMFHRQAKFSRAVTVMPFFRFFFFLLPPSQNAPSLYFFAIKIFITMPSSIFASAARFAMPVDAARCRLIAR